jgi:hypothetical protein
MDLTEINKLQKILHLRQKLQIYLRNFCIFISSNEITTFILFLNTLNIKYNDDENVKKFLCIVINNLTSLLTEKKEQTINLYQTIINTTNLENIDFMAELLNYVNLDKNNELENKINDLQNEIIELKNILIKVINLE